jgi:hypothetical protein
VRRALDFLFFANCSPTRIAHGASETDFAGVIEWKIRVPICFYRCARLHNELLEKVTFDVEWLANESLPCFTGEHSRCEENTPNKLAKTKNC